jgi:hypothetical protein
MNDSEIKTTGAAGAGDVNQPCACQCDCLQRQVTILLLALAIISGTFFVFLWRQVRYARRDLEAMKPPASQIIQEFNQSKPTMDAFIGKLAEYGRTHADFAPIVTKYKISSTAAPAPTATSLKPAAVSQPAAAKPAAAPAPVPKK